DAKYFVFIKHYHFKKSRRRTAQMRRIFFREGALTPGLAHARSPLSQRERGCWRVLTRTMDKRWQCNTIRGSMEGETSIETTAPPAKRGARRSDSPLLLGEGRASDSETGGEGPGRAAFL